MQGETVMEALILSCSTGGGHNAAGNAIREELVRRGHQVRVLDPYALVSKGLAKRSGGIYIGIAQRAPRLFGFIYLLGEGYRRLPFQSPVYFANRKIALLLGQYLKEHPVDVIVMPHLFPAEVITYMKRSGMPVPKTVFIATDYACIPFTEETDCDYYVIPGKELIPEFCGRGIPEHKLLPAGIPVSASFLEDIPKEQAKLLLGLSPEKHYILVSGGSIGAGNLEQTIRLLCEYTEHQEKAECIVICGNNKRLYRKLERKAKKVRGLHILKSTKKMHLYMKACDVFLSKPGGLSSTEAAAAGVSLIHISPIPGCETANRRFFEKHHMCIAVRDERRQLIPAIRDIKKTAVKNEMRKAQKTYVNGRAGMDICDWLEKWVSGQ